MGLLDEEGDAGCELVDEDDGAHAKGDGFALGSCGLRLDGLGYPAIIGALALLFDDGADATGCGKVFEEGDAGLVVVGCDGGGLVLDDAFHQVKDARSSIRDVVKAAE